MDIIKCIINLFTFCLQGNELELLCTINKALVLLHLGATLGLKTINRTQIYMVTFSQSVGDLLKPSTESSETGRMWGWMRCS